MKYLSKKWQFVYFLVLLVIFELVNTFIIDYFPIYIRMILLVLIAWGYEIIVSYFLKKHHSNHRQ
ncbi:hypothetical protein EVI01_25420 [Enterococcus villorum]|uniref:Uncharacterized protein n=2 Tax=Enterococcus villorum TaxID=112904 RepID=A0A511J5D1_9ENTE|nr:hypothetical protein UAO_02780 [Enterococcus villorum ATCC 700913]EOW78537.1 hypothetical protein I591_00075 [Enterococcus villorum ATCC 700913]GEL93205.1 hypothetical protein EVI01_25420 [Enterococcus villorum]